MTATDRPTGVLGLAVVAVIVGVTDILAGLGDIGIAGGFLSDHGFGIDGVMNVVGVALVAVGILGLATGFGLLPRQELGLADHAPVGERVHRRGTRRRLGPPPPSSKIITSQILGTMIGSTVTAIVAAVVPRDLDRPEARVGVRARITDTAMRSTHDTRRASSGRRSDPVLAP